MKLGRGYDLEEATATHIGCEVLVDVQASGFCHTDLRVAMHYFIPALAVLGHEGAGIVYAISPDVVQIRLEDHVVGPLAQSCGACARNLSGRPFQCGNPTVCRSTGARRPSLSCAASMRSRHLRRKRGSRDPGRSTRRKCADE
jgi:S-(hydroxymethyl)glutathione dehydrogenase / alcohol dehydrogenase